MFVFFFFFFFIFEIPFLSYVYGCFAYMCMSVHGTHTLPMEARRRQLILLNCGFRWLSGPLEGQPVLLIAEPSLQPHNEVVLVAIKENPMCQAVVAHTF